MHAACGPWVKLNPGPDGEFPPPGETVLLAWEGRQGSRAESVVHGLGMWIEGAWWSESIGSNGHELPYPTHWARIADINP